MAIEKNMDYDCIPVCLTKTANPSLLAWAKTCHISSEYERELMFMIMYHCLSTFPGFSYLLVWMQLLADIKKTGNFSPSFYSCFLNIKLSREYLMVNKFIMCFTLC